MVTNREEHSEKTPAKQGPQEASPEPNRIGASTPYDFAGKNLTPYGGLLPVITMLEKLGFPALVEQTLTSARIPRAMDLYWFVLGIGPLHRSSAAEPIAFRGSRPDPDGHSQSQQAAGAIHLLEIPERAASEPEEPGRLLRGSSELLRVEGMSDTVPRVAGGCVLDAAQRAKSSWASDGLAFPRKRCDRRSRSGIEPVCDGERFSLPPRPRG